jgi:hypothetical protein
MTIVPLDSDAWKKTDTFSGKASELVPAIRRVGESTDWSRGDSTAHDWALLSREIVDGSDLSPAVELVLPWVIELASGRRVDELMQAWLLIGEVEIGRLVGGHESGFDAALNAAGKIAAANAGAGQSGAQNDTAAAICLLPKLPQWARLVVLRLIVLGQRYVICSSCGELLDVEWKGTWRIGDAPIEPARTSPGRQSVLETIKETAVAHNATGLEAVDELGGVVRCLKCGAKNDALAILAHPLELPS